MWKIIVGNMANYDFLSNLNNENIEEILACFKDVARTFSKISSSVFCTSAIFPVTSYKATDKKLSIHYHVDNDEEMIRITSVELE